MPSITLILREGGHFRHFLFKCWRYLTSFLNEECGTHCVVLSLLSKMRKMGEITRGEIFVFEIPWMLDRELLGICRAAD